MRDPNHPPLWSDHFWAWLVFDLHWNEEIAGLLAFIVFIVPVLAVVLAFFVLVYCVWAGLRGLPRLEAAIEAATLLDPAISAAFGKPYWPGGDFMGTKRQGFDVDYLVELKKALDAEGRVNLVDNKLKQARLDVERARSIATVNGKTKKENHK